MTVTAPEYGLQLVWGGGAHVDVYYGEPGTPMTQVDFFGVGENRVPPVVRLVIEGWLTRQLALFDELAQA